MWRASILLLLLSATPAAATFVSPTLRSRPRLASHCGAHLVVCSDAVRNPELRKPDRTRRSRELLRRVGARVPSWAKRAASGIRRSRVLSFALLILVSSLISLHRASAASAPAARAIEVPYSAFMTLVATQGSRVSGMTIALGKISFLLDGRPTFTRQPRVPADLLFFLHKAGVEFSAAATSAASGLLPALFPLLWLGAIFSLMRRQLTGATGSVGKKAAPADLVGDLTFDDIAGIDGAKAEVLELASMLREPERFAAAGARLPAGVLMVGPPGTGKTLLARVMAAQAKVPFFYCSGSDFVELFIGRGAARMRALFKEAAAAAPCIIFVDELDALGKQRSLRATGGNDEVEQTLNQMLACMDGLESNENGVVVMAATNRVDILDQALTRPGRFDRLVRIALPDERGRAAILRVHSRKLRLADDVSLDDVAEKTPSFSGAELAALCNEAAIRAARRGDQHVTQADFASAMSSYVDSRRPGLGVDALLGKMLRG